MDTIIAQEMARAKEQRTINKNRSRDAEEAVSVHLCSHSPLLTSSSRQEFVHPFPLDTPYSLSRLPHELLLHIFRATVPPLYQHDPSVITGPRNPWLAALRTRKALVLTCKAFFGPATEVLYEDIVIRRMGQIPALARTLGPFPSESGRDVALLVRRLRMDGCVVWAPCAHVVRENLRLILQRCTSLRYFSFHPHPQFPLADHAIDDETRDGFNPSWLLQPDPDSDSVGGALRERLSTSLRKLDLAVTLDERLLVRLQWFLSAAPNLTILKLGHTVEQDYSDDLLGLPVLILPSVQELQLHVAHTPFQHYICTRWELPSLRLLTTAGCEEFPEKLLQAHGSQLTYFHMRHGYEHAWDTHRLASLSRLASLCPLLQHLVIPTWMKDPLVINSSTLLFVDVWGHHPPPHIFREGWYQICKTSTLPSLRRVRILGTMPRRGWESTQSLDWPLICHPTAVVGDEQRTYSFPGVRAVQTAWGVLHDYQDGDLSWSGSRGVERRDNSGNYANEDNEDTTSVVSNTDSEPSYLEVGDEDGEDSGSFVEEQYDRSTVLRMYQESQERDFLFEDDE